ncbi:hypothetical protein C8F04DRAFT_1403029 [Mycena alexandri]|uniref:Secreted protein n=1 Tax=Mycena alexandri TaxID=1745969 RepID=A0AAD6S664_9AGAR|nr:hypothetical protein C8F04DRAFT_1403029 [Mycena alexandri]
MRHGDRIILAILMLLPPAFSPPTLRVLLSTCVPRSHTGKGRFGVGIAELGEERRWGYVPDDTGDTTSDTDDVEDEGDCGKRWGAGADAPAHPSL